MAETPPWRNRIVGHGEESPDQLLANPMNFRIHNSKQQEYLGGVLDEIGIVKSVTVNQRSGTIVDGHLRVALAISRGEPMVPVEYVDLDEEEELLALAAMDAIAAMAGIDGGKLSETLALVHPKDLRVKGLMEHIARDARLTNGARTSEAQEKQAAQTAALMEKWEVKPGQLWLIPSAGAQGEHRLVIGDSTDPEAVKLALGGQKPLICVTDPPYGVDYDPTRRAGINLSGDMYMTGVDNDDQADWSEAFKLFPGDVLYEWYGALKEVEVRQALAKANFEVKVQIIWAKKNMIISQGWYHWRHEPCQPPGTMVRTPSGEVPIESLKDGDGVLSYDSYSSVITGKRNGRAIAITSRDYDGDLYSISAGGKTTRTTDAHRFTVKFMPQAAGTWCTYLMQRGAWWRVGIIKSYNSRGFGLKVRVDDEDAEAAWILSTHSSKVEAACAEQIVSVKYGIPTTHWNIKDKGRAIFNQRTPEQIQSIYDALDLVKIEQGARQALKDYGRRFEYPLIDSGNVSIPFSRNKTVLVRACNVIPGIMALPMPELTGDSFVWATVDSVISRPYTGKVYSMDVAVDHHYIADGLVTHNCYYAVRKGSTANWRGDRRQTTVWDDIEGMNVVERPDGENERVDHATQKPVECMRRPILNHTIPGDWVYDPFMGSGTTFVAAESTGRLAIGLEINPGFAAVILERLEKYGLHPFPEKVKAK